MNSTESEENERYFRQKRLAYLPDAVSLKTIFDEFVAVNDAFFKATGYTLDKIYGTNGGSLDLWVDHVQRSNYLEEVGKVKSVENFKTKSIHAYASVCDCRCRV